jgi:hypothetical protein
MLHEGFYYNLLEVGISILYYFNVTSNQWVFWTFLNSYSDTNKTKSFTSNFNDVFNSTSGLVQFGLILESEVTLSTTNSYTDFAELIIDYTVVTTPPIVNITKCEYLCNSDSFDYNSFIRNNDVLIGNNKLKIMNLDNENMTNLDNNCVIFGNYKNNICVNLNSNKAIYLSDVYDNKKYL